MCHSLHVGNFTSSLLWKPPTNPVKVDNVTTLIVRRGKLRLGMAGSLPWQRDLRAAACSEPLRSTSRNTVEPAARPPAGMGMCCQVSGPQRYSRGPPLIFRLGSRGGEEWGGAGRQAEDALCSCEGPGCVPVAGQCVSSACSVPKAQGFTSSNSGAWLAFPRLQSP